MEVLNFCGYVNTQPLVKLAILRIEHAIEALFRILPINRPEDRVVAEFFRNILINFKLLSEQCDINMNK